MRALILALCGLLLTGCMVGPDYTRPTVDVPQRYRYEPGDAKATANTEWWKQFGDPALDGLIVEALAHNLSVQVAAANVEQAAAVLGQTRAALYPQVGYSGLAGRERLSEGGGTPLPAAIENPRSSYQIIASASWELDLWGRVRRLSESAQANVLGTEEARRGVILSLVAQVASSYLALRGLDEQLEVAKRTLGVYGESVKLFELQFKYGVVSQMTVQQARSQYETAASAIPPIEAQIAQAEAALSILLGRNPGPIARGKPLSDLSLPAVPAGLPSQLLEQRPDILRAEQDLAAANAQIGAARALYYPTISLTGAFGGASAELSNLFKGPARVWSFAGSITGPIFTGGAISSQVAQAEAARDATLLGYRSAIQSAFGDVENALILRQKTDEQLAAQTKLVKALQEYSRLARLQFDGGYAPYSTVLQAEQQLFPAELNLAQVRTQLLASAVGIYRATGGGWVTEADRLTRSSAGEATPNR